MLLLLIYLAFIALGMPDGLFGVAWPSMRAGFGVPIDAMGAAMAMGTTGYLASSFVAGRLVAGLGIQRLLTLSCALTGLALLGVCLSPAWAGVVALNLLLGLGAGGIDAGLNTYVAAAYGERQMHWMHACYGVGATLGPLLMTASLRLSGGWKPGYAVVGVLQGLLALLFIATSSAWKRAAQRAPKAAKPLPLRATLAQTSLWLSLALFFLYAGAELALGFWAYSILTEARGVAPGPAGLLAASFYALFTLGRLAAGAWAQRVAPARLVRVALAAACVGVALFWLNLHPWLSLAGMCFTGLAIAPVFPALVSGTAGRVGARHAANAIGMQMAAAGAGAALIPAAFGSLARHRSLESVTGALLLLFTVTLALGLMVQSRAQARRTV